MEQDYSCEKCKRSYLIRSGFFFCRGCGNLIDVDIVNKQLKPKKREAALEEEFKQLNLL